MESARDLAGRRRMVEDHLVARGMTDELVLAAFRAVPREAFVPEHLAQFAYRDSPLPIGEGQTISQPYIVAVTIEALGLGGGERVLEIGAGSGYAAALLGRIAREVHTIERIGPLAEIARERLDRLGYDDVHVHHADGSLGWPAAAPYDAIAVAAGGPKVPEALLEQLAIGGRLVMPIGEHVSMQQLVRVTRETDARFHQEHLADVCFVPLIGAQGWARDSRFDGHTM